MNEHASPEEQRVDALRDLVQCRRPVRDAVAVLAGYKWDSDVELVNLTRADATRVLRGYLSGALTAEEAQRWAEALEVRDDVGREQGFEDELTEFVFEMATPEVAGALTSQRAQQWLNAFGGNGAEGCRS
ncbi:hypothetical protein OG439_07610 [Amycolatopsis sp. NBC_01307]|uniref:hypothetical protein n=1 Tax=Amycolatopsis sp. NBC_01307 TaxID=2903561 RepID=UPI002E0E60D1|nr:hypothetical protein OG439_07610 [Amycolatopsis sp. NBC_01307]